MGHEDILHKLLDEVGYIRGKVEGMENHMKVQNGTVATLASKVQGHDVLFGKIGAIVTGTTFILTFVFGFIKEWISSKIS